MAGKPAKQMRMARLVIVLAGSLATNPENCSANAITITISALAAFSRKFHVAK